MPDSAHLPTSALVAKRLVLVPAIALMTGLHRRIMKRNSENLARLSCTPPAGDVAHKRSRFAMLTAHRIPRLSNISITLKAGTRWRQAAKAGR